MKKKLLFCALLSVMFVGCDERIEQLSTLPDTSAGDTLPVGFDAYNSRKTTRSGQVGVTTIGTLQKKKADGGGFGVFAYYTDLKQYCQTYVPNFMYNQGVFWKGADGALTEDYWAYDPVMYWPNEYGSDASSSDEEHLTFFAYAPYAESVSPSAGSVADATYGIVGFSRNTDVGDPLVRYIASFDPKESVDLCWGVVPSDRTTWALAQGGLSQTLTEGLPWVDVYHPKETATQAAANSSRIKFKFNHALAQLNVQIDTDADVTTHQDSDDDLAPGTKVYVRSISFTGIAQQGVLNLNNTVANKALWLDWCGCTDLPFGETVTVHDGRRDSREGAAGAEAYNETPQGLNPDIIQNSTSTPGVTHKYQNLFRPSSPIADPENPTDEELEARLNDAVCVIPTGEEMTVTIVYDIETTSPNLSGFISDGVTHGVSIENKITKTVNFGGAAGAGLESGKRYTLKLHLGLNSVKFNAEVGTWIEKEPAEGEEWLPGGGQQDEEDPITFGPQVEDWDDSQEAVPLPLTSN
ncbi:MAG: fimbrillin family protein [Prevotella sp.]|nr:fimbrillin family protein [Prevotella sp.]